MCAPKLLQCFFQFVLPPPWGIDIVSVARAHLSKIVVATRRSLLSDFPPCARDTTCMTTVARATRTPLASASEICQMGMDASISYIQYIRRELDPRGAGGGNMRFNPSIKYALHSIILELEPREARSLARAAVLPRPARQRATGPSFGNIFVYVVRVGARGVPLFLLPESLELMPDEKRKWVRLALSGTSKEGGGGPNIHRDPIPFFSSLIAKTRGRRIGALGTGHYSEYPASGRLSLSKVPSCRQISVRVCPRAKVSPLPTTPPAKSCESPCAVVSGNKNAHTPTVFVLLRLRSCDYRYHAPNTTTNRSCAHCKPPPQS